MNKILNFISPVLQPVICLLVIIVPGTVQGKAQGGFTLVTLAPGFSPVEGAGQNRPEREGLHPSLWQQLREMIFKLQTGGCKQAQG